jgi:protein-S-isoprenylcysteine O-methyltransferase Ste14
MSRPWRVSLLYFVFTEGVWVLVLTPFLLYFEYDAVEIRFAPPLVVAVGAALLIGGSGWSLSAGHHLVQRGGGTPWPFRPPPRLVTTGPYARTRNPQATGMLAVTIGVAVALDSNQIWFLPLLAAAYLFIAVLPAERRHLEELHGAAYVEYRTAVPGWWPRRGLG